MSLPTPPRQNHAPFCRVEGWTQVRDARGRNGTHHVTYELAVTEGRILRTRISHPVDRSTYGASLWKHILRDQLDVGEPAFRACVQDGVVPDRGASDPPTAALPAYLLRLLISRVGLDERDVAAMSRDEAVARLRRFWTEGR